MKLKFLLEDGYLNVKAILKKYELIARQLAHIDCDDVFSYVEQGIFEVDKGDKEEWHMSFNATFLQITKDNVRCSNLYQSDEYIDISIKDFSIILAEWKSFIKSSKNKYNYKRTLEF